MDNDSPSLPRPKHQFEQLLCKNAGKHSHKGQGLQVGITAPGEKELRRSEEDGKERVTLPPLPSPKPRQPSAELETLFRWEKPV